jgi:hypothetical protein
MPGKFWRQKNCAKNLAPKNGAKNLASKIIITGHCHFNQLHLINFVPV